MINQKLIYANQQFTALTAEKLAKLASRFNSEMHIMYEHRRANVKSLIGLISISLKQGDEFYITADGEDEQAAISAVIEFFEE